MWLFISALYCGILDSVSSWCLRFFFTIFGDYPADVLGLSSEYGHYAVVGFLVCLRRVYLCWETDRMWRR